MKGSLIIVAFFVLGIVCGLMRWVPQPDGNVSFVTLCALLFTVGVTVGITPTLSNYSHIILIAAMFLGRVGIMSFSVAFLARGRNAAKIRYPVVDIMIG